MSSTGEFHGAIAVPWALSFLAFGDRDATVVGLEAFPRDEWPPVLAVRTAFQVMVGAGSAMALAAVAVAVAALRRRRLPDGRRWLLAFVAGWARWGSWRWRRAGWSPSGAASRGSCAA